MAKKQEYSEEIQKLLKTVYDDCMNEDVAVRERQIRQWRRLKLLWEGFQRVWYSEVAHDWRIYDESNTTDDSDQASYDKPINVFKSYLESIIAALSVNVPPIKCFPDDADNTLDLATAKAGDKIAQLVYRHNDAPLLWLHALFIFVTEGMTACYSYPVEDEKYGTYEEKEYEEVEGEHDLTVCSNCGQVLDEQVVNPSTPPPTQLQGINPEPPQPQIPNIAGGMNGGMNDMGMQQPMPPQMTSQINPQGQNTSIPDLGTQEKDEFMPDDEDAPLHAAMIEGQDLCPACMTMMDPEIKREKFITTRLVGTNKLPKTRMCLEVYGGLYVKIPNYVKRQKDLPYLIFDKEQDCSMVVEEFEHLHGKKKELLKKIKGSDSNGAYNQYAQWGRLSPQYQGEYPINVVTVSKAWIRPGKFNILNDLADVQKLKKEFPDGVKVTFVNDLYADACNESLDDCWTIPENPLSDYLHFEPLGMSLTSIQEITNDLISLVLQTIEHGIGQTFADPAVLSFSNYEQSEVTPGGVFPATPKSGKSLNDGFHELKTASLSSEVMPFQQYIQSMGQLASGALPSLFGGQMSGGGETASQYSMSRAQALQRLQNTWKMYTLWWKNIFGKVIPMYIKTVQEDERDVQQTDDGNFVNVLIHKADLEGKIGKVELEANENLPLTWSQTKDTIEKLMVNGNPEAMAMISAPENIGIIHEALGLVDMYVPGEDDMIKQYDEIKLLLESQPIQTGDPQVPEIASVEIDPDFDNHKVEFEICRKWIISPAGRQTKNDNEPGYRNVLLHGKAHLAIMQQQQQQEMMMANQAPQDNGAANPKKPNSTQTKEAPIQGVSDVHTVK